MFAGPLRSYINGAQMGLGKTICGITTIYMRVRESVKQHEANTLPNGQEFKPSMWITRPELDAQSTADFLRAYVGLLDIFVIPSTAMKRFPDEVNVTRDKAEWARLTKKWYQNRFLPEVCELLSQWHEQCVQCHDLDIHPMC